ncbi:MAG: CHAT domain-containing tetratricopeptide repeat protein [Cyanobacteria bacterium P01_H01_bin.121]
MQLQNKRYFWSRCRQGLSAIALGCLCLSPLTLPVQAETARQTFQQETDRIFQQGTVQALDLRLEQAIVSLEIALQRYRKLGNRIGQMSALGGLGLIHEYQGDPQRSLDYFQQAVFILERLRLEQGPIAAGSVADQATNPVTANFEQFASDLDLEALFEQRLALARLTNDRRAEAYGLFLVAMARFAAQDYVTVIANAREALKLIETHPAPSLEQNLWAMLGVTYLNQDQYAEAIPYFQQHYQKSIEYGDPWGQGIALNNWAFTLALQGQTEAAITRLFEAIAIWEELRREQTDLNKIYQADIQQAAYSNLQRLLVQQGRYEQALEVAERGRAQAFIDLLNTHTNPARARDRAAIGDHEPITIEAIKAFAQEHQVTLIEYSIIVDEHYRHQLYIWVVPPSGQITFVEVDLEAAPINQRLKLADLGLHNLVQAARCFGRFSCERQILRQGRQPVVVDSAITGRSAFATQAAVQNLDGQNLDRAAIDPQTTWATPANIYLQGLYGALIEPIAAALPTEPDARLVFIPHGNLFLVPFAALQTVDRRYLIEDYAINTAPSIQALRLTTQRQQQLQDQSPLEPQNTVVVGNPAMPAVTPLFGEKPQVLTPLPFAEREAVAIADLLDVEPLLGAAAQKSVVLEKLPTAKLIHMATHGYAKEQQGQALQSWIALAPEPDDATQTSGLLTAAEVLDLNLQALLVVLSACETGEGRITGDGVVGLSRAWLAAGAGSVLVSLWPVADQSTAVLMQQFYRNVQQGLEPDKALRQAMLTLLRGDYPNPYDWAAFTLVGGQSVLNP